MAARLMAEIGFYHLTRTGIDRALPLLLGRTLAARQRAVVLCADAARVAELDEALWACTEPDWLPHGSAASGDADLQPIWLSAGEDLAEGAPNRARFLFLADPCPAAPIDRFDRVFDLFDGRDDAAVAAARARWRAAKAAGHGLSYWQQGARGWEKKSG